MSLERPTHFTRYPAIGPVLIAAVAATCLAAADPPPGWTTDEPFNVQQGHYLVESLRTYGLGLLTPESLREVFTGPAYLPDHPPLARLAIGLFHHAGSPDLSRTDWGRFDLAAARRASQASFLIQILLIGLAAGFRFGPHAGWIAAGCTAVMPRLTAHAQLASLESTMGLTYAMAVLALAHTHREAPTDLARPHRDRRLWLAGGCWGLALLTKIQAVLLFPAAILWLAGHWRRPNWKRPLTWAVLGGAVFFLGWPWLWFDPLGNTRAYFASTTDRTALRVWYFGKQYLDHQVPWHYPLVQFLTTVPVLIHLLAGWGCACRINGRRAWREPRERLVLLAIAVPLVVFSWPGIAVYDGPRLFLIVFPLWAFLAGRGAGSLQHAWHRVVASRCPLKWQAAAKVSVAAGLLAGLLIPAAVDIRSLSPCGLSYYNGLAGGLAGAEQRGLEISYWGDGLHRDFLAEVVERLPAGATVDAVPVAHPLIVPVWQSQWNQLSADPPRLRPLDHGHWNDVRYLLTFRRMADLPDFLRNVPQSDGIEILLEVRRQGVQVAALYRVNPRQFRIDPDSGRHQPSPAPESAPAAD